MKIELRQVLKKYKSVRALDEVSLTIEPGQVVALLGPNGAGKTTLLRCLAGTVSADKGEVLYDGEKFLRQRLDLRRRFFFLPDFPAVFDEWRPLQHLGMVLRLYQMNGAGVEERAVEVLREFDLLPLVNAPFFTLSRGQRYKTSMAALLLVNPELWLLDEPFASGMDPNGINSFKRRAREAAAKGQTVIYSTQILDAAERFSDRICVIHRGKVRAFEPTAELLKSAGAEGSALDDLFKQLREEDIS
ncbi:MAG TPA: ABC transporter ATP-binding protein [Candidatus Eisenbacteria bacterium]|nr:ABC transporter ATP-binding protein [Candidatus Eisenbacteria bacterium]